jgi:hypothetical protein
MRTSFSTFMQACDGATTEDAVIERIAGATNQNPDVKRWMVNALQFFRSVQEHLIFSGGPAQSSAAAAAQGSGTGGGVFPEDLSFPQMAAAEAADTENLLLDSLRQMGADVSSQLTRVSVHMGLLLSQSSRASAVQVSHALVLP